MSDVIKAVLVAAAIFVTALLVAPWFFNGLFFYFKFVNALFV